MRARRPPVPLGIASFCEPKCIDIPSQPRRLVRRDSLKGFEPILDRTQLCSKLRILAGQKLDSFERFLVALWMKRHSPGIRERITVLDLEPVVQRRSADANSDD